MKNTCVYPRLPSDLIFLLASEFSHQVETSIAVCDMLPERRARSLFLKMGNRRNDYLRYVFRYKDLDALAFVDKFTKKEYSKRTWRVCMWHACSRGRLDMAMWLAHPRPPHKRFSILRVDLADMFLEVFYETSLKDHRDVLLWLADTYMDSKSLETIMYWAIRRVNFLLLRQLRDLEIAGPDDFWNHVPMACSYGNADIVSMVLSFSGKRENLAKSELTSDERCHRKHIVTSSFYGGNPTVVKMAVNATGLDFLEEAVKRNTMRYHNDVVRDTAREMLQKFRNK